MYAGEDRLECKLHDGTPWSQPSYPYAAKCLRWLREDYAALSETARAAVDDALAGSGAEVLFGEVNGWPKPGMGSAVASDDWSSSPGGEAAAKL